MKTEFLKGVAKALGLTVIAGASYGFVTHALSIVLYEYPILTVALHLIVAIAVITADAVGLCDLAMKTNDNMAEIGKRGVRDGQ